MVATLRSGLMGEGSPARLSTFPCCLGIGSLLEEDTNLLGSFCQEVEESFMDVEAGNSGKEELVSLAL